jgi:putative hemolysin
LTINFIPGLETDPFLLTIFTSVGVTFYPFTPSILAAIICIIILLIGSAFASGSEVAFFSLSPSDRSAIAAKKTKRSRLILRVLETPERLLATILIANNFINIAIVIISSFALNALMTVDNSPVLEFLVQVVIVTFIILLFGEILPKLYGNRYPQSFAFFLIYFVSACEKIFYPLASALVNTTSFIKKRLAIKKHNLSMNDLSEAIELASDDIAEEKNLLESIIKFGNIDVGEIMTPRISISAINIKTRLQDMIPIVNEYGYSRIPVYDENIDNIKGILYIKDLLPHLGKSGRFKWQSLIRPPYYVPENKKIDDLLREFQTKKIHMAVVVDEYGGTGGIITMEDIIEEIVGDIMDESDKEDEVIYQKVDENNYIFDGRIFLKDFLRITGSPENLFDDIKGDADTLAGLILEKKGEIPPHKTKVHIKGISLTIESADRRRIKQIKVTLHKDNTE